ncbi:RNA polymerase sigma factor [Streptomyces sp. CWNU-1]|uniref:RNA polymerase sigma factor n=2 Tax=Streptomyces albipurpureus TaxID=2897419 RepID=A0ABT0UJT5_9ACTN|nr:RNA polymerase sigma factor [Streptomyces sp. CWNU-1]
MGEMAGALPERLAADLDQGFAELVQAQATGIRTYLLRLTGATAEAEDLTQDTFLRAYVALQNYSPARRRALRPRAWLMSIATNVWRNDIRNKSRRPVSAGRVEGAGDIWPDDRPGPDERALTSADRKVLVDALVQLPERYRVAIVLRHVAGMSYAEIAEVQDCPVGTVKAQVSRGLTGLRALLIPQEQSSKEVTM